MSARKKLDGIISKARKDAWAVVENEVRGALPPGWSLHFAAGWGLTLIDASGKVVFGTYKNADALPKKLSKACLLAADFIDLFGQDNEVVHGEPV